MEPARWWQVGATLRGPGTGWLPPLGWATQSASAVDAVQLDVSTDLELPQSLQGLLAQAGGPQALAIECQLQPTLLAQEQHLKKPLGVKEEGRRD